MSSVTGRIKEIKQPRGGYINPNRFEVIDMNDGRILNEKENVHASVIGMVVDYLTRFTMGADLSDAFSISMLGATFAEKIGFKHAIGISEKLLSGISGLDDQSIINACKLVTFDVWYRAPMNAVFAKTFEEINPDEDTIENIRILVQRSLKFFEQFGQPVCDGFTFEPENSTNESYKDWLASGEGNYGGYTAVVNSGDGDFLTHDTLWDFKVSNSKPTNKHTLQLAMYWIMGLHSGQEIYKDITKLGIFNPRLNKVYLLPVEDIDAETIKVIEENVICY